MNLLCVLSFGLQRVGRMEDKEGIKKGSYRFMGWEAMSLAEPEWQG